MRALRFARWLAQLCIGMAFVALGVLAIVGIDAVPNWPWFIPGGAILLSVLVLVGGSRTRAATPPSSRTTPPSQSTSAPQGPGF